MTWFYCSLWHGFHLLSICLPEHFHILIFSLRTAQSNETKQTCQKWSLGGRNSELYKLSWSPMGKSHSWPKKGKFSHFLRISFLRTSWMNYIILWFVNLKSVEKINQGMQLLCPQSFDGVNKLSWPLLLYT